MRHGVAVGRDVTPEEEERQREEEGRMPTEPVEFRDRPDLRVVGMDDPRVRISSTLDIQDTGLCGFVLRCEFRVDGDHHTEAFARAAAAEQAVRGALLGEEGEVELPDELPDFVLREISRVESSDETE